MGKVPEDHHIAVKTDRLRPGMYVAALDRLWLHTPFPPGGFPIRSERQIRELRRYCTHVYIDPLKSDEPTEVIVPFTPALPKALAPQLNELHIGDELPHAEQALKGLSATVRHLLRSVRLGKLPEIEQLNKGLRPVVESVRRCPDALLWLISTEPSTGYMYRRASGSAILAAVFGHRLGFDEVALTELALGGVLLDIGKTEIPVTVLAKTGDLTHTETDLVRRHVEHALAMLRAMDNVPERVVNMLAGHHERIDGSGYPHRQRGTEIPLYARMAGIVDTYDAITQERRYAPAISAHTALRYLNNQRNRQFDDTLIQEFIQALGIYPTGTWVELLDGSIGVVCAQNRCWPLAPRVAVLRNRAGEKLNPEVIVANRSNPIVRSRDSEPGRGVAPGLSALAHP
jgi:HD-GYP domain-containing protein (c-di-GMP phosphodiesterase class II)